MALSAAVDKATDAGLLMPDWDTSLQISDFAATSRESAVEVARLLRKKLANLNPKVVVLALTLADCVIKNGSAGFIEGMAGTDMQVALAAVCRSTRPGSEDAQQKAAEIVQTLGLAYKNTAVMPFAAQYGKLLAEGVRFPPPDRSAVGAINVAATPAAAAAPAPPPVSLATALSTAVGKLRRDLAAVRSRVALAARMMLDGAAASPASPGFLDAVDFLQQCEPRLRDLVEAGVAGVIADEALFDATLSLNEAVARVLESAAPIAALAERGREAAAAAFVPASHPGLADLVDYDAEPSQRAPAAALTAPSPATGRTTGGFAVEEAPESRRGPVASAAAADDLLGLFAAPAPVAAVPAPAPAAPAPAPAAALISPAASNAPVATARSAAPGAASAAPAPISLASFGPAPAAAAAPAAAPNPFDTFDALFPAVPAAPAPAAPAAAGPTSPVLNSGPPDASAAVLRDLDALLA